MTKDLANGETLLELKERIDGLVAKLEHTDTDLEDAMVAYEEAMLLVDKAQTKLDLAEQRIRLLDKGEESEYSSSFEETSLKKP